MSFTLTTQSPVHEPRESLLQGAHFDLSPGAELRLIELRHEIHSQPELAFNEVKTAAAVANYLKALGLHVKTGVGGTGVVAMIEGSNSGPVVGLRVDMDALPITESSVMPYASKNPGVMHACGHDLHTVVGLGVAHLLNSKRHEIRGSIKLIFQPAEETVAGALAMIEAGVLTDPPIKALVGFHNSPQLPVGTVAYMHGASMAATDSFDIDIIGKSAHAAQPHMGLDAVVGAAQIVLALQTVIAREISPLDNAVLTIGKMQSGTARNAIAQSAHLEGTVRYLKPGLRTVLEEAIRRVVTSNCDALRLNHQITWRAGAPPLVNNESALRGAIRGIEAEFLRSQNSSLESQSNRLRLVPLAEPSMGAEDFAYFSEKVPSAHLRLGSQKPGLTTALHRSNFDVNDDAIAVGVKSMSAALIALLNDEMSDGLSDG